MTYGNYPMQVGMSMDSICKHCGQPIMRRAQNGPWKHVAGGYSCTNSTNRAEPKVK